MANVTLEPVVDSIHRLARKWTNRDATDADLMNRFLASRDEEAFAGLLARHARLVWDVCRRVHGNVHDAEDSFQATFFVLASQAGTIRRSGALASWLYRLAYRTAMHAKRSAYRRRRREQKAAVPAGRIDSAPSGLQELQAVLDSELNRLAEKYRAPFVLCCLEGKSKSEAAAELGWKEGTVSSRLAGARKLLQDRLTRRGITLSAVLTAGAVSGGSASAAIPSALLTSTAPAALQFALGRTTRIGGCASAATLANGVLKAMLWQKVKVVSVIFLATLFLGTGTGVLSYGAFGAKPLALPTEAKPNGDRKLEVAEKQPPGVDYYGEPLPPGAVARMGTIQFRHPPANSQRLEMTGDPPVTGVAFSPDGRVLATSLADTLRLWNANTGKLLFEIKDADLGLWGGPAPAFSPDGRFLAATLATLAHYLDGGVRDAYVCLWDARTGKLAHRLPPESGLGRYVRHILFSPDSKLLAMTDENGKIHLWNTDTGKEAAVLSPKPKNSFIACSAFSLDGKTLVTLLHQPRKIWHWDIATGEVLKVVSLETLGTNKETEEGRTGVYHDYLLSEDGRTLACRFFGDPIVYLLDTSTGKVRYQLHGQATAYRYGGYARAFTPGGRAFALAEHLEGDERKIVSLWNTETGKLEHRFKIPSQRLKALAFSPDGSRMIIGESYIRLYDVASGKELLSKPAHEGQINSLAFTPDSSTLISAGGDGRIGIWDAATGKSRHLVQVHRWDTTSIALVPGGGRFVSAGTDGILGVQDWRTGKEIQRFQDKKPPEGSPQQFQDLRICDAGKAVIGLYDHHQFKELTISGDGKTIIGNADQGAFASWDLATGRLIKSYPRQGDAAFFDLTADGKHFLGMKFLTPSHDSYAVEVREIASGRLLFTEETRSSGTVSFPVGLLTADGRLLIRATGGTIRLVELLTGKERLRIDEGWGRYEKSALSPDGRILATAKRKTLQLWDLITGKELLRHSGYTESVTAMTFSPNGKFLATGHEGDAILVWDVSLPKRKPSQVARSAKELDSWWQDLAGEDAARAHTAIWNLVGAPEQAVRLFRDRLPAAEDRSERITKLIAQLDDDNFAARKAASKELQTLRSEAEPALRRRLNQQTSLEERRRIEEILAGLSMQVQDPELVQAIRAIEVLEYIATPDAGATRLAAVDLLKKLAAGAPEARRAQAAKAALWRLHRRPGEE